MRKINKNKVFYFVISLLLIACISITGIKAYKEFFGKNDNEPTEPKKLDSIDMYGYSLDEYDSELYKTYFNELKDVLNKDDINYEDYAKVETKLFITDLYTLSTKISSSDIGGLEFVYPDFVSNFKMNAGDTMYNHIKNNLDGTREQKLPTVSNVTVSSVTPITYIYGEKDFEAYRTVANWEYEEDLGYENSGEFTLVKHDNKLYVVEKTGE